MSFVSVKGVGFGGKGTPDAVPRALAELQGLTFSLVTGANANTAITVPGIEAEDTVASIINLTDLTQIDLTTVTVGSQNAKGTLTVGAGLVDGDKVLVNGKTYTFTESDLQNTSTNYGPGIVPFEPGTSGVDTEDVAALFAKVLMSSDNKLRASAAGAVVTVTARAGGTVGNSITLDVSQSNGHVTASGATLAGGTASTGITISTSTASKKLLVIWFNKNATGTPVVS